METAFLKSAGGTSLFSVVMMQTWPKFGQNLKALIDREINSRLASGQKPLECDHNQVPCGSLKRSASVASLKHSASGSSLPSVVSEAEGNNRDADAEVSDVPVSSPAPADSQESQIIVHGKRLSWKRDLAPHIDTCHRGFLVKRIGDLEKKLTQSKQDLAKAKRENNKSTKQLANLQLQIHTKEQADEQVLTVQKTPKGVRFTTRGYLAMGIRKALAITSALGFPMSALVDASRQTVIRCEVCVWSVLVARTGCFHEMVKHRLRALATIYACMNKAAAEQKGRSDITATHALVSAIQQTSGSELHDDISRFGEGNVVSSDLGLVPSFADGDTPFLSSSSVPDTVSRWFCTGSGGGVASEQLERVFCLGGTAFAGDATNSGIWRRNKLQGLLLTSACMTDSVSLSHPAEYMKAFAFHTTVILVCDLQVVNSGTAANNLAIVMKQLRTAKCPNWEELADMFEQLSLH
ncbi:unnamed protein product [Symbiodinium sp. CCMP2592]|nr:unnamed protein product [Symbiodinium sp. CCMP2592]